MEGDKSHAVGRLLFEHNFATFKKFIYAQLLMEDRNKLCFTVSICGLDSLCTEISKFSMTIVSESHNIASAKIESSALDGPIVASELMDISRISNRKDLFDLIPLSGALNISNSQAVLTVFLLLLHIQYCRDVLLLDFWPFYFFSDLIIVT
jgi:hypothetical protein